MLKKLTREEFERRAARSRRVAVFEEFLADRETPVAALSRLDEDEEAFLLESVAGGETIAKHGNVASTSMCGSADVLRELGLNLAAGPAMSAPSRSSMPMAPQSMTTRAASPRRRCGSARRPRGSRPMRRRGPLRFGDSSP